MSKHPKIAGIYEVNNMIMHNVNTDRYEVFVGGMKCEECATYEDAMDMLAILVAAINA